jgi:hypothetical protein
MLIPPVSPESLDLVSSLDCLIASFKATSTISWSISISAGSNASLSILTSRTSWSPLTLTLTAPPPEDASKFVFLSSSCIFPFVFGQHVPASSIPDN